MPNFGSRLRQCRLEAGLKQVAAAKLMKIGQQSISDYENNKAQPSADVVVKMAKAYGVSADYLLGMTDEKE